VSIRATSTIALAAALLVAACTQQGDSTNARSPIDPITHDQWAVHGSWLARDWFGLTDPLDDHIMAAIRGNQFESYVLVACQPGGARRSVVMIQTPQTHALRAGDKYRVKVRGNRSTKERSFFAKKGVLLTVFNAKIPADREILEVFIADKDDDPVVIELAARKDFRKLEVTPDKTGVISSMFAWCHGT